MSLATQGDRITRMRLLLRDTDTVRPTWTDAQLLVFLDEVLAEWNSQTSVNPTTVSMVFGATDRTKTATLATPASAMICASLSTGAGKRLHNDSFFHVRKLQETEGRTGTSEIYGVLQTDYTSYDVAIYPLGAQTVVGTFALFDVNDPAGSYVDLGEHETQTLVLRAVRRLASLEGLSDSGLARFAALEQLGLQSGLAARIAMEAPGIDDLGRARAMVLGTGG